MSGGDPDALQRRIRQMILSGDLPKVSHPEDAYRLMASDSGADAFVNKQLLSSALLPAILDITRRRLSGGSGPLPPGAGASSASAAPK
jgi:hypothetical protein